MNYQHLIGRTVIRKATDYTSGREGIVLQVDEKNPSKVRAQVNWKYEKSGSLVNGREKGLNTWVNISQLELKTSPVS